MGQLVLRAASTLHSCITRPSGGDKLWTVSRPGRSYPSEVTLNADVERHRFLVNGDVASGAVGVSVAELVKFWSRRVYMTSAENVRFLTEVQRVMPSTGTPRSRGCRPPAATGR
jgi:hypothetical protein